MYGFVFDFSFQNISHKVDAETETVAVFTQLESFGQSLTIGLCAKSLAWVAVQKLIHSHANSLFVLVLCVVVVLVLSDMLIS